MKGDDVEDNPIFPSDKIPTVRYYPSTAAATRAAPPPLSSNIQSKIKEHVNVVSPLPKNNSPQASSSEEMCTVAGDKGPSFRSPFSVLQRNSELELSVTLNTIKYIYI